MLDLAREFGGYFLVLDVRAELFGALSKLRKALADDPMGVIAPKVCCWTATAFRSNINIQGVMLIGLTSCSQEQYSILFFRM